jgi:glutamyl-tRNA synthetase
LGGALVAFASWIVARRAGGSFVLRIEDLDLPRVVRGSAERIADDLRWLSLDWDEGPGVGGPYAPYVQSRRFDLYEAHVRALEARGGVYGCDCSRAEIARGLSAPHAGEEAVYPGTCREKDPARAPKRPFSQRLRLRGERVSLEDLALGPFEQELSRDVGDFVLRRGDGLYTYQLAVAADDLAMGITHVVRGADLLASTPRQIHLMRLFGGTAPAYAHVPLVVGSDGARLEKRTPGAHVRALRDAGVTRETIIGAMAHALGLQSAPTPALPTDFLRGPPIAWPRASWRIPRAFDAI